MIKLVFASFLFFSYPLSAKIPFEDTIVWSDNRLAWGNFKGNYDTAVYHRNYLAITSWKVLYQYMPLPAQNKIDFIVYTWFDARKSWVRPTTRSSKSLLLHEQGHFDLAELLSRQFRQQLSATTFSKGNYTDSIKQIFSKLLAAAYATQQKYDAETSHGMNSKRQAIWEGFIASKLKRLEGFANKNGMAKLIR